jgi:hypothetical protein
MHSFFTTPTASPPYTMARAATPASGRSRRRQSRRRSRPAPVAAAHARAGAAAPAPAPEEPSELPRAREAAGATTAPASASRLPRRRRLRYPPRLVRAATAPTSGRPRAGATLPRPLQPAPAPELAGGPGVRVARRSFSRGARRRSLATQSWWCCEVLFDFSFFTNIIFYLADK